MKFHFSLTPVNQIAPWSAPSQGNAKSLHWFGLSDGWYWIEIDGHALLRYSDALGEHWQKAFPEARQTPYVDYQVVRLWEDVLEMLPAVLDPVPDDLARLVAPDGPWGTWRRWQEWSERVETVLEAQGEEAWNLYSEAANWWDMRRLDFGYLRAGFRLWFWRAGDTIHVRWDNEDLVLDGIVVWQEAVGSVDLTVGEFLDAVCSFDAWFIAAMGERVGQVREHWSCPEVFIDIDALEKQQTDRATWLERVLGSTSWKYEWDLARAAVQEIEAMITR